ncbi:MAG: NAD(P)-dependent oxidoreductase [Nitrospirales bacterium]
MIAEKGSFPVWVTDRRIALTGASGLLGNYFCRQLVNLKGFIPIAHSHPVSGFSLARAVDLRNRDISHALMDSLQPEIIIHAAAETNVEKCEEDPAAAVQTNVDITKHLVDWVQQQSREVVLVFLSTDQLYDGAGPHHENRIWPRNVYALTKCAAETIVRGYPHHLIVRVNFVGWSSRGTGFMNWLVNRLTHGDSLTLVDDVWFNPLSGAHLVNLILQIIGQHVKGTYNVGATGRGWSKAEFGLRLGRDLGLDLSTIRIGKVSDLGLRAMRPNDMTMEVGAVEAVLGYSLPTMEDTVKQLVSESKMPRPYCGKN